MQVSSKTSPISSSSQARSEVIARGGDWLRPLLTALGIVVALRVLLSAWAAWSLAVEPPRDLQAYYSHMGITLQQGTVAAPWQREDALWYERIAVQGYGPTDGTTVFPPLMPLSMRAASIFTFGNVPLAGLLVGAVMTVAALFLLYRLAVLDVSEKAAYRSVLYVAVFPTAFLLLSAYSEALFLALVVGSFLFARQGRWGLVALFAFLAGLTRVQGALLILPLVAEYLTQNGWRIRDLRRNWLRLIPLAAAAPLGTLLFFAYTKYVVGAPLSYAEQQAATWHQQVVMPWEALAHSVGAFFAPDALAVNRFDLLVFVFFTVLTVAAFRLRLSYGLYASAIIFPALLHVHPEFPLMSLSRFALVAFPCFIALASFSVRGPRYVHPILAALFISLLFYWAGQFVHGYWVA